MTLNDTIFNIKANIKVNLLINKLNNFISNNFKLYYF